MTPFKVALWIAKFVAALALLLVVIPTGVFYGGMYAVSTYQEHQATKARRAKDCAADRAELQSIAKDKKNLSMEGLPEGSISRPMATSETDAPSEAYTTVYTKIPPVEPLTRAGVGGNAQHPLWYFSDGSSIPLDEFIKTTQKDMEATCER